MFENNAIFEVLYNENQREILCQNQKFTVKNINMNYSMKRVLLNITNDGKIRKISNYSIDKNQKILHCNYQELKGKSF